MIYIPKWLFVLCLDLAHNSNVKFPDSLSIRTLFHDQSILGYLKYESS
jgi:hypothetical protein